MKKQDYRDLDGHILRAFLAILEHSSVSVAAEKLDLTQSAVSHILARLRRILGDPLFVRSGQGLVPTEAAIALKEPILEVLDGLQSLTHQRPFDPRNERMRFVVAANDMQRDLIFPQLFRETQEEGIAVDFEFMPSGQPNVPFIREGRCQLAVTPVPPDAPDIFQKSIMSGRMTCYYDGNLRSPPRSWEEYCDADHIVVRFVDGRTSQNVLSGVDKSGLRPAKVTVSNFNAVPPFVKGTRLIATHTDLMRLQTFGELNACPLPFETDPVALYMIWHERSTNDPAHMWLRSRIQKISDEIPGRLRRLGSGTLN